jgi:hypothetical protein
MDGGMSNLWEGETAIDWREALYFDQSNPRLSP